MKIKFYDIKNSEETLNKLMNQDLPFKYARKLQKNLKRINDELIFFEEKRKELLEKYGEVTDNILRVKNENKEKYLEEYKEMLNTEIDLDIEKIPISFLDNSNIKLSPYDINNLEFILDDIEEI